MKRTVCRVAVLLAAARVCCCDGEGGMAVGLLTPFAFRHPSMIKLMRSGS